VEGMDEAGFEQVINLIEEDVRGSLIRLPLSFMNGG
jgi:hypothetical protein